MLLINELEYAFSCTYSYMFYTKKNMQKLLNQVIQQMKL